MPSEPDVIAYEKEAAASGFLRIAGVDEAGRGPLAGPVVAAAVIFDFSFIRDGVPPELSGLTDSKALTAARRDRFFSLLMELPQAVIGTGQCSATEIDEFNILQATHLAMRRALQQLKTAADFALVDGNPAHGLPCLSKSIIKGDAKSLSISAASVIAKVTRDRQMEELDRRFPEYGFARHKGYGTREHLLAIQEHGPAACHRMTFRPISGRNQLELGF